MTKNKRNTKLYESTGRPRGRPRKDFHKNRHVQNDVFISAKLNKLYVESKSCAESECLSDNNDDFTRRLLSIMYNYKKMYFDRDSLMLQNSLSCREYVLN